MQISEVAGKEFSIELALDKMAAEWATAEIAVLEYRDTGTFVIKLDDAVLQQLDDHIGGRSQTTHMRTPMQYCLLAVHGKRVQCQKEETRSLGVTQVKVMVDQSFPPG